MHKNFPAFLAAVVKRYVPTSTVLLGDILDLHALSRFTRSPSGLSAWDELRAARRQLAPLYDLFPRARVCWGNHDTRIRDRAAEAGIPAEVLAPMGGVLGHPKGWEWADRWEVDGVTFEHGNGYSGKDAHTKAAAANMAPTVIGHIHAHAGIAYTANRRHLFWGFNVGCGIDHNAYAFAYAKAIPTKPIIGVGLIENGVPRFVPMTMSRGGRWTGRL
jgi:metallophosphoesterase superfamily enzyme